MKWQIVILLFLTVVLQAETTIWFREDIGSPIYKKCVFKKKKNQEQITESYYLLADKSTNTCILLYEHRVLLKDGNAYKQILYNHNNKQKISLQLAKDKINVQVVVGKNKNTNTMNRPQGNVYFPLSGRIYNHPDIFTQGKKFYIQVIPVPIREITVLKLLVEVLPKARIPNSRSDKLYFVAETKESGAVANRRVLYYDKSGTIVYSINKSQRDFVRKRISKPNISIQKIPKSTEEVSDKVKPIAPIASVLCREIYYSHAYPRNWERTDISPFSTAYKGKGGTIGAWTSTNKFSNNNALISSLLEKLGSSTFPFSKIESREDRKVFMGRSLFTESLIKCESDSGTKYILMLTVLRGGRNFAMVVFGNERQYKANWPTWINTLHSFVPNFN
ncbi:hypothetical protein [Candidatus Uabimicrobium amorphum]|uniref:Uncharacterized protein n=1 Tax=Uabimicrobium amorphum TaxID=2596890 RepID=A0A5S9IQZ5_UABAM|nr:hypothetical protein [Candidatus Uabimicrobium amorphum]BBM86117.1 hypothetical protein UABAM_04503 [Candidatus Uabimicrobium amorphum]